MSVEELVADDLAVLDGDGLCVTCGNTEDDCLRYHSWCLGRTARLTRDNPQWRESLVDQIRLVLEFAHQRG